MELVFLRKGINFSCYKESKIEWFSRLRKLVYNWSLFHLFTDFTSNSKTYVKNCSFGAGIRTHNLLIISLLLSYCYVFNNNFIENALDFTPSTFSSSQTIHKQFSQFVFFKKLANIGLFLFIFIVFSLQFQYKLKKA